MKRIAIVVIVVAVAAIALFFILGNRGVSGVLGRNPAAQPAAASQSTRTANAPAIKASGQVTSECRLVPDDYVNLSFNTGGLVSDLLVREGQHVTKGQLVATLSGREQAQSSVATAQLELINAQQALKQLYDEAPLRAAEAAQQAAEAPLLVQEAERLLNNARVGIDDQADVDEAVVELTLAESRLDRAREAYEPYKDLPTDDEVKKERLEDLITAQQDYDLALSRYNSLISASQQVKIARAEADLELAKAKQVEAERVYETLKNGPDPDEVALAQGRLSNAQAQLAAAQAALQNLELTAPFDGTVASMDMKLGQYVGPGVPVILIVGDTNWQVETTDLTELNVVRILEGAPAVITFDALPELKFDGRVERVGAVGETRQGDITYTVLTSVEDVDPRLRWNMTCSIVIQTQ